MKKRKRRKDRRTRLLRRLRKDSQMLRLPLLKQTHARQAVDSSSLSVRSKIRILKMARR